MRKILHVSTHRAFANTIGAQRSTVTSWFGDPPCTPTVPHVLALARVGISPSWLLLGEGEPELRGAKAPLEEVASALHAHISGVLAAELMANPGFVALELPAAPDLLEEILDRYRGPVTESVRQQREWEFRNSLLGRALEFGKPKALTREERALQAALLDWGAKEDQRPRAKPPVDPPGGRALSGNPIVPPLSHLPLKPVDPPATRRKRTG